MRETCLVTGAAGFIGSHTVEALLARGDSVVGVDNFDPYYDPARKRENLREVRRTAARLGGSFTFVCGDIRDRALIPCLLKEHRPSSIVHLAGMPGVGASIADPWLYFDVNLNGTLNVLEAARHGGCPKVIFASTSSAYGGARQIPFVEDDAADRPRAPYSASKRAAELLGHSYSALHGVSFCALRFFTVYGPRGRPDMLAYRALDHLHRNVSLTLYDAGRLQRDWTYVSDVVTAVLSATRATFSYEVINVGRGQPLSVARFVAELERQVGLRAGIVDGPSPPFDLAVTFASIEKARELLGYSPTVELAEGVRHMVAWYRTRYAPRVHRVVSEDSIQDEEVEESAQV